jgi:hypothetical protein
MPPVFPSDMDMKTKIVANGIVACDEKLSHFPHAGVRKETTQVRAKA